MRGRCGGRSCAGFVARRGAGGGCCLVHSWQKVGCGVLRVLAGSGCICGQLCLWERGCVAQVPILRASNLPTTGRNCFRSPPCAPSRRSRRPRPRLHLPCHPSGARSPAPWSRALREADAEANRSPPRRASLRATTPASSFPAPPPATPLRLAAQRRPRSSRSRTAASRARVAERAARHSVASRSARQGRDGSSRALWD